MTMTKTIQQNSSSAICKLNVEMSEIKRVSQENEKLFNALVDSLNNLSEKLIELDLRIKKKIIEGGLNHKNKRE